jgi:hypothetical protein
MNDMSYLSSSREEGDAKDLCAAPEKVASRAGADAGEEKWWE